jgi:hypothetical protein
MGGIDRVYHLVKLMLHIAKEERTSVCPTKLQKVFFLLEKEKGVDLGLGFKPWFFGPYSSMLQDIIDKLIEIDEVDVIEEEVRDPISGEVIGYKRFYVLNGEEEPREGDEEIVEFFRHWVKKDRREILNYVYKKYPEYSSYLAIKREILDKLKA